MTINDHIPEIWIHTAPRGSRYRVTTHLPLCTGVCFGPIRCDQAWALGDCWGKDTPRVHAAIYKIWKDALPQ